MSLTMTLRIAKTLSPEVKNLLEKYYTAVLPTKGKRYATARWNALETSAALLFYRIRANHTAAGWVIFNSNNSTILEFFINESFGAKQIVPLMLDKIITKHKLIAAELPKADVAKYESLQTFGFRPTRNFTLYGIPMVHMDLSTAVYLEKLKRRQRIPDAKKAVVAIEKIAAAQTRDDIKHGLENLIDKLGGLRKFVKKGQTVVLKPNLVSDHGLKNGIKKGGITTDNRVIKAMVEILHPVAEKIIIAEGSSINRSDTNKMFRHYGYDKFKDLYPAKVSLVDLNADETVEKTIPDGRRLQTRSIPKTLLDADVVINMPVLKLHFAAVASLAIKNLQGSIPPLEKYKVHFYGLWQNLINTYKIIMPKLIIVDGLFGQEDFGPVSGSPVKMDLLLGGTNPVAVDTVALQVMGLRGEDSPPVLMAHYEGLGPITQDSITIKGHSIAAVRQSFKRPVINLTSGKCFSIHNGDACPGCEGYLHFVLNKLRRPDPRHHGQQLIDRPFKKNINVFIGPHAGDSINPAGSNIFMGICQQHHADCGGVYLPGCPPHAEEIINGIFRFYEDIERPKYADKTEEAKLGELLKSILSSQKQ